MVAHRPCPRCELRVPRLTANLTAKLLDNRGSRRTALDGYIRPELRRCGRRGPPEQLTSPRVVEVPLARRAPNCQLASCSRRHQARLAAANGARWLALGVHRRPQVASDRLALGVAGRGLRVWIMAGGVDGASDYLLKVNWIASPTPGKVCQQADPTGRKVARFPPTARCSQTLPPSTR